MDVWEYESPLGRIFLAGEGDFLTGLWFDGQKYFPDLSAERTETPVLRQTENWLDRYFAGEQPESDELPLAPKGSEFQQQVWALMRQIPYGRTVCYAELSRQIARLRGLEHMSAQAVGGAVGHNPISIIQPCHRVLGSDGSLTGYAGGLKRKAWLLELEQKGR